MKCSVIVVFTIIETLKGVLSVAIDGACSTDTDCTADNLNTFCRAEISSSCEKGVCMCNLDYEWDPAATKCKRKRYHLDSCTSSDSKCQAGTSCDTDMGMCTCSGNYNSVLNMCLQEQKKAVGETCADISECYKVSGLDNSVQCVAESGTTDKKCQCVDGYMNEGGMCIKPRFGSFCLTSVGCTPRDMDSVNNEASFVAETCVTSKCQCTNQQAEKKIRIGAYMASFCVVPYTGTKVGIGQVCADTSKCSTGFCYECPEETDLKCVVDST